MYELEAYGSEFGHHCQTDQGRFAFQEMDGDFDVSARVVELGNDKKSAAKACLMVREADLDPASRFAAGSTAPGTWPRAAFVMGG